jgi:hypothetical protein
MPAIKRKLALEQGAVYQDEIRLKQPNGSAVDLTGCSARMQIRDHAGVLLLTLSTAGSGLVINGPAGTIQRLITAPQTAALPVDGGQYDLEITPPAGPDYTWRLYQGAVTVNAEVTRD